ncbi:MAG TPA: anthrone oxygenase family protein [Polyangiaceae bacterium]
MTFLITLLAALGCGLIAGVFFGFSSFVMPALARLPPAEGVRAMQSINVVVLNRSFLGVLLGTALICGGLLLLGVLRSGSEPGAWVRLAGSCLYLAGTMLVTGWYHVPRNARLARLSADSAEAERFWPEYVAGFCLWNHVRGAAALAAAALLTLALLTLSGCSPGLAPIAPPGAVTPVARLSELGIFQGELAKQLPQSGFVAYEINAPLYADGARKRRFVFVPPGTRIQTGRDRWSIPVGSYLVKTFSFPKDLRDPALGERLIETRFLRRTADGFTASTYVWNDAQTDASASRGDLDVPVSWIDEQGVRRQQRFHVPSARQCAACHAGRALGLSSRQLDRQADYGDGTHDQISHWARLGLIDQRPPAHLLLTDPAGDAPLAGRARSYLDANCSHCHGAGGSAERTDLFWDLEHTSHDQLPSCRPTRSIDGRDRVLVPGHPEQSEFLARMRSDNPRVHMPRGPSQLADAAGISLLTAWVAELPAQNCEP